MVEILRFHLNKFLESRKDSFHIARTTLTSITDIRLHSHDYAEIFWIENGGGTHYINNKEIKVVKGNLCIIRPQDNHTFAPDVDSSGITIANIAFDKNTLNYYNKRYGETITRYFSEQHELPFTIQMTETELAELSTKVNVLIVNPKNNLVLDNFLTTIFLYLEGYSNSVHNLPHWLQYAIESYIAPEQFKCGLKGFIELTNRNIDHVNRTIKKYFQLTLTEFINELKLKYAAHQLIMTNESIKKICSDCGYKNLGYFYKVFNKYYGTTPKRYRSMYHKIF